MSEDYLWDRSGEPDPEIKRLEQFLSRYGDSGAPLMHQRARWPYLAIAASVLVVCGLWFARRGNTSEWRMAGHQIETGRIVESGTDTVKLEAGEIGQIDLEPHSRLELLRNRHLALYRGTIHAFIWAPPERFQVETPSAKAVDLGCEYTLKVDPGGSGLLTVQMGWVAFQAGANESFIPAGAACRTLSPTGPGLPYFTDAPEPLQATIRQFDTGTVDIAPLLAACRPRDALTLWHLILRTNGSNRRLAATRFAELVPGVNAQQLAKADPAAIDAAWAALGLGETKWWRHWKRKW